ncbi:YjgN family protein [Nereida sp. MMG025]|uniref:YjgN family protein n=1 Tax=Nereida sp. MMG025 TaxID=2909981 RepID=UPI001F1B8A7E|nr:DUF898 domain-containing protein [Nereida sp. MMG025]MCF6445935.1 DUF898 domain-containing protein [Nereida sp. MMG025]
MLPNRTLHGRYTGQTSSIFMLALTTGFLTILTLGIYRFWAKSRIRRYIWNATQPGGDPMEYTGTGVEKFIGFLIAIVILAVYLGIVQLALAFAGFNMLDLFATDTPTEAQIIAQIAVTYIVLLALLPLIYIAQYRARRYMLSRTRWRGLRFGAEQASVGYMLRAVGYLIVTILSLGLLAPLGTFKLEKYKTDRSWYGDAKFQQGGRWTMLYKPFVHILIPFALIAGAGVIAAVSGMSPEQNAGVFIVIGIVAYIWFLVGIVHYRLQSFAIMARHKTLDNEALRFHAEPMTGFVIGKYIVGALLASLITGAAFIPAGVVVFLATMIAESGGSMIAIGFSGVIAVLGYLLALAVGAAATMAFITQPIYGHIVENTSVLNAENLAAIQQRSKDDMPDAEGFADALDVGGAF